MNITYLSHNIQTIAYLIQCLTQTSSVMRGVHLCKAQQSGLRIPIARCLLLDPVPGNSKVGISITSLPSIAGQTDFTGDGGALVRVK